VLYLKAEAMEKPTEDEIRVRAYDIWVEAGKPHGRHEEFWNQAENELNGEEELKDMPEDF
jgi:Protein of unknown function (DUF2934)